MYNKKFDRKLFRLFNKDLQHRTIDSRNILFHQQENGIWYTLADFEWLSYYKPFSDKLFVKMISFHFLFWDLFLGLNQTNKHKTKTHILLMEPNSPFIKLSNYIPTIQHMLGLC